MNDIETPRFPDSIQSPGSPAFGDRHLPVLLAEVLRFAALAPAGVIVDGTLGLAGHTRALLEALPDHRVVGLDRDEDALALARERTAEFGDRARCVHGDFSQPEESLTAEEREHVTCILLDLGLSSLQIDRAGRGFSFDGNGPLDMRADQSAPLTAEGLIAESSELELAEILSAYGNVRFPRHVARALREALAEDLLHTTFDVVNAVRSRITPGFPRKALARVFQALRIAVNDEVGRLQSGLRAAVRILQPGGVLIVIAYHSLEDREVKTFLRAGAVAEPREWEILTKHVVVPGREEERENRRSRSAKLRAARRVGR